jgi:hypothetical protein
LQKFLSASPGTPKIYSQNEKATRQQGDLFLQGRIVPTEAKPSKLSEQNLMGRKSGVSSDFYDLNAFRIIDLKHQSTTGQVVPF